MELKNYNFPKTERELNNINTDYILLAEAEKRELRKGREKFNQLFFNGGTVELKDDVRGTWKEHAYVYARSLMGSFTPKHEHKESVCAMIFEECLKL